MLDRSRGATGTEVVEVTRRRVRRKYASLVVALFLFPGCQGSLPAAPTALETGVVVYEHANFLGASAHITADIPDLREFKGPCIEVETSGSSSSTKEVWNDCISSLRVAPGWIATLYGDDGHRDDTIAVTEDVPNLQIVGHDCPKDGLNDCVSSIRVGRR
jgi:hypothetical protein